MKIKHAAGRVYRSLGSQVRAFVTGLGGQWSGSLATRVVAVVIAVGLVTAVVGSAIVVTEVRSRLFDRSVAALVDQYSTTATQAQYSLDSMNAATAGQIQQYANDLVAGQYDPVQNVYGGALLRTPGQSGTSFTIAEPVTQSTVQIRDLITTDLRKAVRGADGSTFWQSVGLVDSGHTTPGIIVGSTLRLGGAGNYEFYSVYSLESQETILSMVSRILTLAQAVMLVIIAIAVLIVVRYVVRPVRQASQNAQRLAAGAFDVHMNDDGEDELAQLGRSFNQMADSLRDQIAELERLSNVQRDFVSAVSHELRTPVTTIRMAGQLIYDKRAELPSALKRSAELQHNQLINLDVMLADLLEISRFDAGAMTLHTSQANLVDIVVRVVNNARPLADDNGVEVTGSQQGDTTAEIEPRRVERIVRNLVVNALEHAEGGHVHIRVVGGATAVAVEVSDNGIGLSEEQAAHVFDRFWRADESRVRKSGGTGLGLTIAREDALLHGGRLQAIGELGVGATFLLTLPRTQQKHWTAPLELHVGADVGLDPADVPIDFRPPSPPTGEIPKIPAPVSPTPEAPAGNPEGGNHA